MAGAVAVVPAHMGRRPARTIRHRFHRFRPTLAPAGRACPRPAHPATLDRHRLPRSGPHPARNRPEPTARADPGHPRRPVAPDERTHFMIILGIILLIVGFVFTIPILWTIGIILIVVGVVLAILGATGRAIGGRKYWY